jgi:hypothetical protein
MHSRGERGGYHGKMGISSRHLIEDTNKYSVSFSNAAGRKRIGNINAEGTSRDHEDRSSEK